MRPRFRILALLLALVLSVGVLAGCASVNRPLNYLKTALQSTLKQRFGGVYARDLAEALNGGLVELRFGGADPTLFQTPLQAAELKLWIDREALSVSAVGSATVGNKTYDGKAFLDHDGLIVSSHALLGSTDLGIPFATLADDLKNSIFRNNSGSEYMLPWLGDTAAADVTALKDGFFTVLASLEEWGLLTDEMAELFLGCLADNLSGEWYTRDGRVHINVEITNEILSRSLRDLHSLVVRDGDFCRALRKAAATRDAVESARAGNGTRITACSTAVENLLNGKGTINSWCNFMDNELAPFRLSLSTVIRTSDDLIETASLALQADPERDHTYADTLSVALDLSNDSVNKLTLGLAGVERTLSYTVSEDGLRHYRAYIEYTKSEQGTVRSYVVGELSADRYTDRFELSIVAGEESRYFSGSFDRRLDGFDVSVDGAAVNGQKKSLSVALSVDVDAAPEQAPERYKSLFNLSYTEYRPIHQRATAALADLKRDWGEAPLSLSTPLNCFFSAVGIDERITD